MNPYLEQDDVWDDFHCSFIAAARDALVEQLFDHFVVRIKERKLLQAWGTAELDRQTYLEISDHRDRRVVTAVTLMGPTQKRPAQDRKQLLLDRLEFLDKGVSVCEIDLLRRGYSLRIEELCFTLQQLRSRVDRPRLDPLPYGDYNLFLSRATEIGRFSHWPIRLRDRLPAIPVPLLSSAADASLDLQTVLHRVYDAAGYANYIYAGAPQPALSPGDALWAAELIATSR
jgi:hypothetical protein